MQIQQHFRYKYVQKISVESMNIQPMEAQWERKVVMVLSLFVFITMFFPFVRAWTGEIHGRVVCDVCGDSSIGPEDHVLEGYFPPISFLFSRIFLSYIYFLKFTTILHGLVLVSIFSRVLFSFFS